jgi:hypothetical protein
LVNISDYGGNDLRGPLMNFPNYQDFLFVWGPISKIPKVFSEKCKIALTFAPKYGILACQPQKGKGIVK